MCQENKEEEYQPVSKTTYKNKERLITAARNNTTTQRSTEQK